MAAGTLIDSGSKRAPGSCGVCIVLRGSRAGAEPRHPVAAPAAPGSDDRLEPAALTLETSVSRGASVRILSLLGNLMAVVLGAVFLTQFPQFAKDTLAEACGRHPAAGSVLGRYRCGVPVDASACRVTDRDRSWCPSGRSACRCSRSTFTSRARHACGRRPDGRTISSPSARATGRVLADLFLLALFGRFLQRAPVHPDPDALRASHRARSSRANNILNALFLILAAGLSAYALKLARWSIPAAFPCNRHRQHTGRRVHLLVVPEFLLRFLSWLLVSGRVRIRKQAKTAFPNLWARAHRQQSRFICHASGA